MRLKAFKEDRRKAIQDLHTSGPPSMPTNDTAVDDAMTRDCSALAAITDTLDFDPSSPDLNDEPRTWEEAQ